MKMVKKNGLDIPLAPPKNRDQKKIDRNEKNQTYSTLSWNGEKMR